MSPFRGADQRQVTERGRTSGERPKLAVLTTSHLEVKRVSSSRHVQAFPKGLVRARNFIVLNSAVAVALETHHLSARRLKLTHCIDIIFKNTGKKKLEEKQTQKHSPVRLAVSLRHALGRNTAGSSALMNTTPASIPKGNPARGL